MGRGGRRGIGVGRSKKYKSVPKSEKVKVTICELTITSNHAKIKILFWWPVLLAVKRKIMKTLLCLNHFSILLKAVNCKR